MSQPMGLRAFLLCSALFAASRIAPAQTKVGVINLQQAVFQTAEIRRDDAAMQAKYKPRSDEAQKLQADINNISQQIQAGQGKLTPRAEADLQAEGTRKQRDLQRMNEDLQADVERDRNDILSKASLKMQEIVKKIAEEKGLDMVVDSATTLYFKPAMDITADAVAAYDKAHPVAAPASTASRTAPGTAPAVKK
jgi:outer membrane protein